MPRWSWMCAWTASITTPTSGLSWAAARVHASDRPERLDAGPLVAIAQVQRLGGVGRQLLGAAGHVRLGEGLWFEWTLTCGQTASDMNALLVDSFGSPARADDMRRSMKMKLGFGLRGGEPVPGHAPVGER